MKASDLERAQKFTRDLASVREDITELAKVPAIPNGIHLGFRYLPEGRDPKKLLLHIDLTEGETEPVREQVYQILCGRRDALLQQLAEMGVDPDA